MMGWMSGLQQSTPRSFKVELDLQDFEATGVLHVPLLYACCSALSQSQAQYDGAHLLAAVDNWRD